VVNETASPASLARTLADSGGELVHPDVIDEDVRWRSPRLFTAEELKFDDISAAIAWMEKLGGRDDLRQSVLSLKRELESILASQRTSEHDRQLAREISQWLTIWLQNPRIFPDWFALRRNAAEFRERFKL
jgi:hypothetical protein